MAKQVEFGFSSLLMCNILPLLFIDVLKGSLVDLFNKVLLKIQLSEGVLKITFQIFL